jgi:hypothetical protein
MPARKSTTAKAHPNDYKKTIKDKVKATRYDQMAIGKACSLYLAYNGKNLDRVVTQMRRTYPGFAKATLQSWAIEYNWDFLVEEKIDRSKSLALTDADELYDEVKLLRKKIFESIKGSVGLDDDLIKTFLGYARESRELLLKLKAEEDTLGGFVGMLEKLLEWLPDYSIEARDALIQVKDEIIDRATSELGEKEIEA